MSAHRNSSSWNILTISANLVALVLMVVGLWGVPGPASTAVASAGTLLLGASSLHAVYLGRRAHSAWGSARRWSQRADGPSGIR